MGVEHGVGEILQGSQKAPGMIFPSWPDSAFFAVQAGEPSFSLIPDMLVTGILASLFSVAYISTIVFLPDKRNSRALLLVLSVLMFLTGGGIFPPILAILISLMAGRLSIQPSRWKKPWSKIRQAFLHANLALDVRPCRRLLGYDVSRDSFPRLLFQITNDIFIYTVLAGMFLFLFLANESGKIRDIELSKTN